MILELEWQDFSGVWQNIACKDKPEGMDNVIKHIVLGSFVQPEQSRMHKIINS